MLKFTWGPFCWRNPSLCLLLRNAISQIFHWKQESAQFRPICKNSACQDDFETRFNSLSRVFNTKRETVLAQACFNTSTSTSMQKSNCVESLGILTDIVIVDIARNRTPRLPLTNFDEHQPLEKHRVARFHILWRHSTSRPSNKIDSYVWRALWFSLR